MVYFFDGLFLLCIVVSVWFSGYVFYRLVSDESNNRP